MWSICPQLQTHTHIYTHLEVFLKWNVSVLGKTFGDDVQKTTKKEVYEENQACLCITVVFVAHQ